MDYTVSNTDIEKCIIGALVMDKHEGIYDFNEDDFTLSTCQLFFKVIRYMKDKEMSIDIISVSDMASKKLEDALSKLVEMTNSVYTVVNFDRHKETLKMYSTKRKLLKAAKDIQELIYSGNHENVVDLKNDAMQLLDVPIEKKDETNFDMKTILFETLEMMEKEYNSKEETKLHTGYPKLDKVTNGVSREEMTIIAARPGVGKTALALQLMINLAMKGNHCLFISREMSRTQICKRIISNVAKIDGNKLRTCKFLTDNDWGNIGKTQGGIGDLPIQINDKISSIQEIRAYCRKLKNDNRLDVLFVDYLGLVKSLKKNESRRHEVEDVSRQLKEMSLEFGISVIPMCQLNREGAKANREPELCDLRDSGSLEQDADNVWFLHQSDSDEPKENPNLDELKIIIAKQRNGPTGFLKFKYYKNLFAFYDS